MKNMRLTTAGAALLGTTHADGTPRYWIGYYGLAYVSDHENDNLDVAASSGTLTQTGDYIFNIWQGDMLNGYAQANPEDTAAASLFGLTLYDKSIRTNYRYVYDVNTNRNRLVAWKSESTGNGENTLERKGAAIYMGTDPDGTTPSQIPLPAPLYYGGEPSNATVATITPAEEAAPVSADYRYYVGTRDGDEYGWKESSATQADTTVSDEALLNSISNFNKFHGTVSAEGYGVSSVSSCHNMSKATKLFPISYYNVVNDNGKKVAETQYADNSPARKPLASAIKFSIDLSPVTADTGYTALNYEDGGIVEDQAADESAVYESKYISFKFNRIGIYAVPMTVHRYSTDSSTDECNLQKVQFEIDADAEPILFAVADINDTIISDNPSSDEGGVAKFSLEFILNLGNTEFDEVERRTAVYYDLYERDATTWFKNQLLASASLSEAVTDLSLELNSVKQQVGNGNKECCSQDLDLSRYALKNHTHDYLKNLVDGVDKAGSVRGIYTCEEGDGKDIVSLFGLSQNAPSGALKSCILHSISSWESGTTTTIPDSYVYCEGYLPNGGVPRTDCITIDQLTTIVKVMGMNWVVENVVTGAGYKVTGSSDVYDEDHVYIWTDLTHYAKIDVHTGEIEVNTFNAGSTDMYQAIVIEDADAEAMFSDGYSVGTDSLALGESTAAAGDYSLVQGNLVYSNSDYATILGSNSVKCDNSPRMTMVGASGFDVKESATSIVFGTGIGISGAAYNRPTELKNLNNSIVGGVFYDDGHHLLTHGINASMWLMQQNGPYSYGADGAISGSIIAGNAHFGNTVRNSMVLRISEDPTKRIYGKLSDSILLGEGYSYSSGLTLYHDDELDKTINLESSIAVEANVHAYYSDSEKNYHDFLGTSIIPPALKYSIITKANIHKPVSNSLILSSGSLEIAPFSVNAKSLDHFDGGQYNLINMAGSTVGKHVNDSVLLGGGCTIPEESEAYLSLGGTMSTIWYDDIAIPLATFNSKVADGTIADGTYAILGDGNLTVWNSTTGAFETVSLSGEANHIYKGVVVTNKHPSYSARVKFDRVMYYNNDTSSSTKWTKTLDFGTTNANRVNAGSIYYGINIGGGNTIGSPGQSTNSIFCLGSGNNAGYTNIYSVTLRGGGITLNGYHGPYAANGDTPLFPNLSNVHIYASGITLGLGSPEPYATNEYSDALIFLNNNYDKRVWGVFEHPISYWSQPNNTSPGQSWAVDYSDPANASSFVLDPNLFDNYKRAWIALDPTNGETIWNNYNVTVGTTQPAGTTVTWSQVTEAAEADEQETDVYRGYNLYGFTDPFSGKTRAEIRRLLTKPNAPMVYTGGIALAGFPNQSGESYDKNFGLIKLGHVSKPVAYINTYPVSGWNSGGNLIYPVSVTGTTDCPFGGMMLAIDNKQEPDGTMHLVLSRGGSGGSAGNTQFTRTSISVSGGDVSESLVAGKEYNISGASGTTVTLSASSMNLGEETLVIVPSSGPTVKLSGQTLNSSTTYLIRRTAYIASEGSSPSPSALAIPCSHIH